jgi:hypothetical protein
VLLGGCSQANSREAHADPSASANATFTGLVEKAGIGKNGSPAALRDTAGSICAGYAHGHSFDEIITDLTDSGWSAHDARELNSAAVAAYCPDQKGKTQP